MRIVYFCVVILILNSCIQHTESIDPEVKVVTEVNTNIKYANGFSVDESNSDFTKITINSIESTFDFRDSIFLPHVANFEPNGRKVVKDNYESLALQSSTYLAFLHMLHKVD